MARKRTPVAHSPTHTEEVELNVVSDFQHTDDWHFMRLEDGTVAVQPGDDEPVHAVSPADWSSLVASVSASGEDYESLARAEALHMGTAEDGQPAVEEGDAKSALKWAMNLLTHPTEQHDFCSGHGKVPITHSCVYHKNADFEKATKVLAEVE